MHFSSKNCWIFVVLRRLHSSWDLADLAQGTEGESLEKCGIVNGPVRPGALQQRDVLE